MYGKHSLGTLLICVHTRTQTHIVLIQTEQLDANNTASPFCSSPEGPVLALHLTSLTEQVFKKYLQVQSFFNLALVPLRSSHFLKPQLNKQETVCVFHVKEQVGRDSGPPDGPAFQHPTVLALIATLAQHWLLRDQGEHQTFVSICKYLDSSCCLTLGSLCRQVSSD